jgi:hypothetical protein
MPPCLIEVHLSGDAVPAKGQIEVDAAACVDAGII